MSKISLSAIRAARDDMTSGKYMIAPELCVQGTVYVVVTQHGERVATIAVEALGTDPECPHVQTQLRRYALGFAVMSNHMGTLLEIAEAALAARVPITDEESARFRFQAEQSLDAALKKVAR